MPQGNLAIRYDQEALPGLEAALQKAPKSAIFERPAKLENSPSQHQCNMGSSRPQKSVQNARYHNPRVGGSSPSSATNGPFCRRSQPSALLRKIILE